MREADTNKLTNKIKILESSIQGSESTFFQQHPIYLTLLQARYTAEFLICFPARSASQKLTMEPSMTLMTSFAGRPDFQERRSLARHRHNWVFGRMITVIKPLPLF